MKRWLGPLLIVLAGLIIFGPVVRHELTNYDDPQTIAANSDLTPPTGSSLGQLWTTPQAGLYVPITYSLWWLIAWIGFRDGQMQPAVFHGLSLVLHASCGLLVWLILRKFRCQPLSATVGALVFVLHPMQVETVAWASGAKDQLATLFSLLAVLFYVWQQPATVGRMMLVGVCLLLAMLAKPVAVVTPIILAAIDLIYFEKPLGRVVGGLGWTALLIVPILLIARSVQGDYADVATPLWQRPFIAGDALAFYLVKVIWPVTLTHLYGRTPMRVTASPTIYWVWLLPFFASLVLLGAARRKPLVLTGAAIFVIGLLPVLGLTPFEFQIHSTVADHYLYLPMVGVAWIVAGLLNKRTAAGADQRLTLLAVTLILSLLAFRSATQLRVWQSSVSLNSHAVAVTPWSADAHGSLGVALAEAGRVGDAVPSFEFVARQYPQNWTAQVRLAQAYLSLGQFQQALQHAVIAVQLTHDRNVLSRLLLVDALAGVGRREEAIAQLKTILRIEPDNPIAQQRMEALRSSTTQP